MEAIDDIIIPYLLELASDDPIVDVDVSRFETDNTRVLYPTESAAVLAFAQAIKIPFADLTGAVVPLSGERSALHDVQDRDTAKRRWAFAVGRGVLRNAAKDIRFGFVDRAFGGRGIADKQVKIVEQRLREQQDDIDLDDDDGRVEEAELIHSSSEQGAPMPTEDDEQEEPEDDELEYEDDSEENTEDSDEENDSEDQSETEEGLRRTNSGRMLWRSEFGRRRFKRERVERNVPCAPHTRVYTGHCNVKTVKDVNYFGLMDEYVVSGSDSGHVFIWDRKTAQLVNILEGDGEVVNVVQGHPYEPTMAVSGIDHTIKIFSPNSRDQFNARRGIGVQSADSGNFSSLNWSRRRREREPASQEAGEEDAEDEDSDSDKHVAANGLSSRRRMHQAYQITSQNDMDRKGGREDYFISRAVFAQLARHMAAQQGGNAEGDDTDGDGPLIITEDNCSIM